MATPWSLAVGVVDTGTDVVSVALLVLHTVIKRLVRQREAASRRNSSSESNRPLLGAWDTQSGRAASDPDTGPATPDLDMGHRVGCLDGHAAGGDHEVDAGDMDVAGTFWMS